MVINCESCCSSHFDTNLFGTPLWTPNSFLHHPAIRSPNALRSVSRQASPEFRIHWFYHLCIVLYKHDHQAIWILHAHAVCSSPIDQYKHGHLATCTFQILTRYQISYENGKNEKHSDVKILLEDVFRNSIGPTYPIAFLPTDLLSRYLRTLLHRFPH